MTTDRLVITGTAIADALRAIAIFCSLHIIAKIFKDVFKCHK